ncbi:MAG: hypothetical protein AAF191_11495 [Verrucomicrobiota bacterium]
MIHFLLFFLFALSTDPQCLNAGPSEAAVIHDPEPAMGASLIGGWDSHYVLEGRDTLEGDSLWSYTLEGTYKNWTAWFWHAESPDVDFTELNVGIEYGLSVGDWDLYASYLHLQFLTDEDQDHEFGFGVAYNGLPWGIVPAVDWYHSIEANGSYTALSVSREMEVCEGLVLTPSIFGGFNSGYLSDGHRGSDHVATMLEAAVPLSERLEFGAYLAYSWAVDRDVATFEEDAALIDFLYGGAAFTLSF